MTIFQYMTITYFVSMAGYSVLKKDKLKFLWYAFLTFALENVMFH